MAALKSSPGCTLSSHLHILPWPFCRLTACLLYRQPCGTLRFSDQAMQSQPSFPVNIPIQPPNLHCIRPSCYGPITQPFGGEPDSGSGTCPQQGLQMSSLLYSRPPSHHHPPPPAGKACHLRGGEPQWTNWGFVIFPYNGGAHALLDKGR